MTLSLRSQRALQALILAGLGLFLLHKLWTGTLYWYINQRFLVLVLFAGVAFLGLARVVFPARAPFTSGGEHPQDKKDQAPELEPHHEHVHMGASVWGLVFLAIPLALGILIPARPLGSEAISNRGINITAPLTAGGDAPVQRDLASTDRNILDWVRAFNYSDDPRQYVGEPADVIGFVYHAANLDSDVILVSRFAVTCCSADAAALGLLVRWPDAPGLESNAWVRIRGPIEVGTLAGRPTPLIAATSVEGVDIPDQPYLYP